MTTEGRASSSTYDQVPVLMYHSIADASSARFQRFVVPAQEFAWQMNYLVDNDYRCLTMLELTDMRRAGVPPPASSVAVTFDDGYLDFHSTALPIIDTLALRATLFVPTLYVGRTAQWLKPCGEEQRAMLSWQALREVSSTGVEVSAHTH